MKLKVEYLPIGDLKTYANNAKRHPEEQVEQIKKSIQEFGFNDPIALWRNNEIIEGHGRLYAAMELGLDAVPVIRLDDLTDEQRRAYALVHNKLTMNSGFDIDMLSLELGDIQSIDMDGFGFLSEIASDEYIDDFFERGVEAVEKSGVLGVKVIVETQDRLDELVFLLEANGYEPQKL